MPATRDDILQSGVNNNNFLAGAAVFMVQSTTNFNTSGYAATAFPTNIADIIDLTGTTIGRAKSENGWRNVGYTGGIRMNRNRETVELDADQAAPVLTLHDRWRGEITVTALETSDENLFDFWVADPNVAVPGTSVTGAGIAQYMMSYGSPSSILYRRVAVIHPDVAGRLWAYVWHRVAMYITQSPQFERTGRHEWTLTGMAYPDTRTANVHDRVLRTYRTNPGFLTG